MQYILTEKEYKELGPVSEIKLWKENAMKLSQLLARRVSREEREGGIGGVGCILENDCESKYCYGCPADELCPYEYKRWPK